MLHALMVGGMPKLAVVLLLYWILSCIMPAVRKVGRERSSRLRSASMSLPVLIDWVA